MWTNAMPSSAAVLQIALPLVPGIGPVLMLITLVVLAGMAWLFSAELRLRDHTRRCPMDGVTSHVVTDRRGHLVVCLPSPKARGIECRGQCLRTAA